MSISFFCQISVKASCFLNIDCPALDEIVAFCMFAPSPPCSQTKRGNVRLRYSGKSRIWRKNDVSDGLCKSESSR